MESVSMNRDKSNIKAKAVRMKEHAADAPTLSRWQPGQDVSIRGADPLMTAVRLGYVDSPTSDAQLLTISRRPPAHFGGVNSQDSAAEGPLSPRPLASDASIRTAAPSTVLHQQGQKKRGCNKPHKLYRNGPKPTSYGSMAQYS